MPIEAVIFDIGNVLIEWLPERFYDAEIGEEARKRLFNEVDLHGMNERVDLGHDFRTTIYDTAAAHPAHSSQVRMWHDRWLDLAGPVIPRSVRVMRALQARGMPVYSLTNFGIGSFDLACTAYEFLRDFDRPYVSGHMAVTKPDPRIYQMVEEDCGVAPGALLFADDREDNIAAASARGWQTHLFDGPDSWAERLVIEGLLSRSEAA